MLTVVGIVKGVEQMTRLWLSHDQVQRLRDGAKLELVTADGQKIVVECRVVK
jgi:hypothetical protein